LLVGGWYRDLLGATMDPRDKGVGGFRLECQSVKQPGTIGQRMLRLDVAALNRQAKGSGADAESVRGFCQIHPAP